ncbi:MAG: hypothetical protein ACLFUX_10430 [Spirochaetaceae bacterium]
MKEIRATSPIETAARVLMGFTGVLVVGALGNPFLLWWIVLSAGVGVAFGHWKQPLGSKPGLLIVVVLASCGSMLLSRNASSVLGAVLAAIPMGIFLGDGFARFPKSLAGRKPSVSEKVDWGIALLVDIAII